MDANPIIELKDVSFRRSGRGTFELIVPNFSVNAGETVLLLGESGSGKSTLLSLICGTVLPDSGSITVSGNALTEMSGGQRDRFRAEQIGMIFQQFNLLPFGTVFDNITLPLRFAPKRRSRVSDKRQEAKSLCDTLGLPDLLSTKAATLSVGQQQRVAVARAMIGRPPIIIADEPTSALDETSQTAFLHSLFDQVKTHNSSLLMVSHDPRLGERFDRVIDIQDVINPQRHMA